MILKFKFKDVEIVFEKACGNCFFRTEYEQGYCNNPSGKACENYLNFFSHSAELLKKGLEKGNFFVMKLGDTSIAVMPYEVAFERAQTIMNNCEKIYSSVKKENPQAKTIGLSDE